MELFRAMLLHDKVKVRNMIEKKKRKKKLKTYNNYRPSKYSFFGLNNPVCLF